MSTSRVAYLVLAHDDAPQVARLCDALHGRDVFLHIDARAKEFPARQLANRPGVRNVAPRVPVYWGHFSVIEATLAMMNAARKDGPFDRYVLLSGACYPVKPIQRLELALSDATKEWIALTRIDKESHLQTMIGRRWHMKPLLSDPRLDNILRGILNKISKARGRDLPNAIGMAPYFGSQWWALTGACVDHILEFVSTHAKFIDAYRTVYAPDEHFFHTIVGNSLFADAALRVQDAGPATNQISPLHQIAATEDRTFNSTHADFEAAARTEKFFIRKVSSQRSRGMLDRVDGELLYEPETLGR